MKRLAPWIGALALIVAGNCSKGQDVQSPTSASVAPGAQYQAPEDRSVWADAWHAITEGGEAVADAGEWTFEKAKGGAIVVGRKVKQVAGDVGEAAGDAAVHAQVKTRLAGNRDVDAGDIDVDVDQGNVTLRGQVRSSAEASAAIRTALDTQGVDQVTSYLTW